VLRQVRTFHVVCLGWVFFRADSIDAALAVLGRLATGWGPAPAVTGLILLVVVGAIAVQQLPTRALDRGDAVLAHLPALASVAMIAMGLLVTDVLGPEGIPPFVYVGF
jgi:alginate O-acetyltransferase complex protein AlgI